VIPLIKSHERHQNAALRVRSLLTQQSPKGRQCCQLLTRLFGQINQKIQPLTKKFGPLQNLLTYANITVFYTQFLSAKGSKNKKYQEVKCSSLQIFKVFYMNNHLQKSSAPFRPFFGIFKENSVANFSGRTNFCRAPLECCG
jgi:hypothetical protein